MYKRQCINCLRSIPYVRAWAEKYKDKGLVVIGVHAPEFAFEKDIANVRKALSELKVDYPVAIDNDYAIWRAFKNEYWPAHYFVDAAGNIRHHQFGEGEYERTEQAIQQLNAPTGWLIQIGAFDSEAEARQHLSEAQLQASAVLATADPFTEGVQRGDKLLYRARFAGFDKESAEIACKQLKRGHFECMALKD